MLPTGHLQSFHLHRHVPFQPFQRQQCQGRRADHVPPHLILWCFVLAVLELSLKTLHNGDSVGSWCELNDPAPGTLLAPLVPPPSHFHSPERNCLWRPPSGVCAFPGVQQSLPRVSQRVAPQQRAPCCTAIIMFRELTREVLY